MNLDNVTHALGLGRAVPLLQVALPIAISFFTFMAISYVVDIYRRELEPAKPLDFAVYISFFPHLLAGPDRARDASCCPRSARRRDPDTIDYSRAFWLILAGLFKKVVISSYVVERDRARRSSRRRRQHSAPEAIFAAWGYAVQIYCDFSGYTDIAIGLALLLGFRFPQNFDAPYTARNLQDFWRRWHMTLSRWLRDYLYIPLGGNAGGQAQTVRNIMITMVLGGLWHGAAWTFVIWGAPAGCRPELRAPAPDQPGSAGACRPVADGPVPDLGAALPDLPVRVPGLGLLQRLRPVAGLRRARAASSAAGVRPSPLVTPLLVFTVLGTLALQFVPDAQRGPPAGGVLPPADRGPGRCARLRPARHHHVRSGRRRALHLLPLLMTDQRTPPHHVDWEDPAGVPRPSPRRARAGTRRRPGAPALDPRPRARPRRVRRVVPALRADAAAQRAGVPGRHPPHHQPRHDRAGRRRSAAPLQLSHIVSATGRSRPAARRHRRA